MSVSIDQIVSLSKRRGFIFQSSDIYGGLNGCWDYGPLGVELLRNVKEAWWREMTYRDDIEGLDASILMHPRVWEASGHTGSFADPMIDNRTSKKRYRADHLIEEEIERLRRKEKTEEAEALEAKLDEATEADDFYRLIVDHEIRDPAGGTADWTEVRQFNLMFKTFVGPVEDSSAAVYLRPETAQGIFVNFTNVMQSSRQKIPFGIAQIGKAFRNEINTKNFLFRTREFEQMEMQWFVAPGEDERWYDYWLAERQAWFTKYGVKQENLRTKVHPEDKLAHYAKAAVDIEYQFPFGWGEIEGVHNRTDFDLARHAEFSGKKIEYFDQESRERFIPYVIETSIGASRSTMMFLVDAYDEDEIDGNRRDVMRFHPALAPYKVAIFPLIKKEGMPEYARKLHAEIQRRYKSFYDESGAIGRRYRRQDEVGTPYCVTIDGDTLEDGTVTIRDRDTTEQIRIPSVKLMEWLGEKIG